MKISFFFILSLFFVIPGRVGAQCEVDAGPTKYICIDKNGFISQDTLGGSPTVISGSAPFIYKWSFSLYVGLPYQVTASDMLSDTTLANPLLIHPNPLHEGAFGPTVVVLEVTDANGAVCTDSQEIFFSQFGAFPDRTTFWIDPGDSIQVYSTVSGGIPPLRFSWTPNYHISDTSVEAPFVWPDMSTIYYCEVVDSAGCVSTFNNQWTILVNSVGLEEDFQQFGTSQVYPNPINQDAVLMFRSELYDPMEIRIFDVMGRQQFAGPIVPNRAFPLGKRIDQKGAFFFGIYSEKKGLIQRGKFIRE